MVRGGVEAGVGRVRGGRVRGVGGSGVLEGQGCWRVRGVGGSGVWRAY